MKRQATRPALRWNSGGYPTRRFVLLSGVSALAASCGDSDTARTFNVFYQHYFGSEAEDILTRAQIEASPYAMIEMRIGKPIVAALVLAQRRGMVNEWHSRDNRQLHTRAGRLVRTVGFPVDITSVAFATPDPLEAGLHTLGAGAESRRVVRDAPFGEPERQWTVHARFSAPEDAPIQIAGIDYATRMVREFNRVEEDGREFENHYWFAPDTGFVWRSAQEIDPSLDPMRLRILKPPAVDA